MSDAGEPPLAAELAGATAALLAAELLPPLLGAALEAAALAVAAGLLVADWLAAGLLLLLQPDKTRLTERPASALTPIT